MRATCGPSWVPTRASWGEPGRRRLRQRPRRIARHRRAVMVDTSAIREGMNIFGSCGARVGRVEAVEGPLVRLSLNDPLARGLDHHVPLAWVGLVDHSVRLDHTSE